SIMDSSPARGSSAISATPGRFKTDHRTGIEDAHKARIERHVVRHHPAGQPISPARKPRRRIVRTIGHERHRNRGIRFEPELQNLPISALPYPGTAAFTADFLPQNLDRTPGLEHLNWSAREIRRETQRRNAVAALRGTLTAREEEGRGKSAIAMFSGKLHSP